MRNLELYKRGLSLLTAAAISLTLSACSKKDEYIETIPSESLYETEPTEPTTLEEYEDDICTHLSLCMGGVYETFKECDGYDIYLKTNYGAGIYSISKEDVMYLDGVTTDYNIMHINHNLYQSDNSAIQKVKTKESN